MSHSVTLSTFISVLRFEAEDFAVLISIHTRVHFGWDSIEQFNNCHPSMICIHTWLYSTCMYIICICIYSMICHMFGFWHLTLSSFHTACGNHTGCVPSWKTSVVQFLGCSGFACHRVSRFFWFWQGMDVIKTVALDMITFSLASSEKNMGDLQGNPCCLAPTEPCEPSEGEKIGEGLAELEISMKIHHRVFLLAHSNLLLGSRLDFLITPGWWPSWQCLISRIFSRIEHQIRPLLGTFWLLVQIIWMRFARKSWTRFIWAMIRRKLCRS